MAKRGVMTFDVVVYAIIAIVILVVVIAFIFGTTGRSFKQAKSLAESTEGDIAAAQNTCTQLCLQASNIDNDAFWPKSRYCTKTFAFDLNSNGKLDDNEKSIKCWRDPVLKDCTARIGKVEVTQDKCPQ